MDSPHSLHCQTPLISRGGNVPVCTLQTVLFAWSHPSIPLLLQELSLLSHTSMAITKPHRRDLPMHCSFLSLPAASQGATWLCKTPANVWDYRFEKTILRQKSKNTSSPLLQKVSGLWVPNSTETKREILATFSTVSACAPQVPGQRSSTGCDSSPGRLPVCQGSLAHADDSVKSAWPWCYEVLATCKYLISGCAWWKTKDSQDTRSVFSH